MDAYHPYFVILIDQEMSQIKRSEIRLNSYLDEVSCDEVFVLKGGIFNQYEPPYRTMDFLKVSNLFTEIVVFIVHCLNLYNLLILF